MKPMREWGALDWVAFAYMIVVFLVLIANIVIHMIGPW